LARYHEELGFARGLREAVFAMIEVRGVSLTAAQRARIDAEESIDMLRSWLREAASTGDVDALLK
jgi:hypothetical protein